MQICVSELLEQASSYGTCNERLVLFWQDASIAFHMEQDAGVAVSLDGTFAQQRRQEATDHAVATRMSGQTPVTPNEVTRNESTKGVCRRATKKHVHNVHAQGKQTPAYNVCR